MPRDDIGGYEKRIIDLLNDSGLSSLDDVAKALGVSRSTLFRRLRSLRRKGLARRIAVKTWCLGYGASFWFLVPVSRSPLVASLMSDGAIRETLVSIYVSYAPTRIVIVKHFFRSKEELEKIEGAYSTVLSDYFDVLEGVVTNYIILPRIIYSTGMIHPCIDDMACPNIEFDDIDLAIVDGFMRGINGLTGISSRYDLPLTTVKYHYHEHVKKIIYGVHYVVKKGVNAIIELVASDYSGFFRALAEIYRAGGIDYIEGVYIENILSPLIGFIEVHAVLDRLYAVLEDLISQGLILDAKAYCFTKVL